MSKNNFLTSFIEFLKSSDRNTFIRLIICFTIFLSGIGIFTWIVLHKMKPETVKIGNGNITVEAGKAGILTVSTDKTKNIVMTLPPNGGTDNEWVDPEIEVSKGDRIKITASGKINLSLAGLVKAVQKDTKPKAPWNGPEGLSDKDNMDSRYPDRVNFKTMKGQNFGMLIAAIEDKEERKKTLYRIGKEREFTASTDGKLLLTINDIWLSPKKKDAYLPPPVKYRDYYEKKVLFSINSNIDIAKQETKIWSPQKWQEEIDKEYNKRKSKWDEITRDRNYGLWYQDNIGSFSVTIIIEQK